MSDFLVNLARRSAGLAPVVRARSGPPPMTSEMSSDAVAAPAPSHEAPRAPIVVALPGAAPSPVVVDSPRSAVPPVRIEVASAPAPVVQRTPALDHVAPVGPPLPATHAAPIAPTPTVPVRVEPAVRERVVVNTVTRAAPESPVLRHERARADAAPPLIAPAIAQLAADLPLPVPVTIQPAEVAAPAIRLPPVESAPERTVHVRIGAIEIYGADAGIAKATPADMSIAAVAAPAANATPPGGFDDYAALRSYTPWSW
jgi:hypothetical protein